jgi:hypothetical protein
MANNIGWGEGNQNNTIGWGKAACNNTIGWGIRYLANIAKSGCGGLIPSFALNFNTIADDFTFTRNSFATRVNENGLIETVTNLGENIVVNGDFTNGSANWSIGSNSEINNGSARIYSPSGSYTFVSQSNVLTIGKTYLISLEIIEQNSGEIRLSDGNGYLSNSFSGVGVHTFTSTSIGTILRIQRTASITDIRIDNVSVKEVLENDIPRIDYTTGEGAFLLEPQSTNLVTYSEDFTDSSWINGGSPIITPNYGTSPDGTQNSTRIQGSSSALVATNVMTGATSGETRSIYVRATSGSGNIQLTSHNNNTNNVFAIDENWQRVQTNSLTSLSASTYFSIDMRGASTDIYDIEVWGAQGEALDYATSYIPTSGSTVTRSAESCVDATPTINSEEGVLYAEISALADDQTRRGITLSDGTTSNRVLLRYNTANNSIQCFAQIGGAVYAAISTTFYNVTNVNKIAYRYKSGEYALYINGVEVGTSADITIFPQNTLTQLNFDSNGSANFYGNTKDLKVYDKALTDEELTELTTI